MSKNLKFTKRTRTNISEIYVANSVNKYLESITDNKCYKFPGKEKTGLSLVQPRTSET